MLETKNQEAIESEHGLIETFENGDRRYHIFWITRAKLSAFQRRVHLGWCPLSQRIFRIMPASNWWRPRTSVDFLIENNVCEEGRRCLNLDCSLNQTSRNSYQKETGHRIQRRSWERITSIAARIKIPPEAFRQNDDHRVYFAMMKFRRAAPLKEVRK